MATAKAKNTNDSMIVMLLMAGAVISVIALFIGGKVLLDHVLLNNRIIDKKNKALSTLNANLTAWPQLRNAYDGLGSNRDFIVTSMPSAPNFEDISASYELMANQNGVKLRSIAPGITTASSAKDNGVTQLRFTASVEGPYPAIVNFLHAVEVSSRPMRVESMNTRATPVAVNAELSILTYYQEPVVYKLDKEVVK
jgi:Tfp pilus assembly protein PilO